jgi:cysteinyl-tRNA synthetase
MLTLYNTRTKQKEQFKPLVDNQVDMYTCGPTVYHYAHIGNLRTYVFEDILRRVLKYNGYSVKHVMNITDVGHLTDDADQGEDKMEKGARREGKTAWEISDFYTKMFKQDMHELNILEPSIWCKATNHIKEQIDQVRTLIDKGYTYETSDGIYFDTTKLDDYGKLANLKIHDLETRSRVEIGEKKNSHDFALWKFNKPGEKRQMEWKAFEKMGFPGWHIECSAMAIKYLGNQFDIHAGGIDHMPVHHTNEIAQTEAATGIKPWVNVWMHGEFLLTASEKMAKSSDNFLRMQSILDKKIDPLAYRYFLLQTHYRKQLTFSWEALEGAAAGLDRLRRLVSNIPDHAPRDPRVREEFISAINDDLNTPEALAVLWTALKSNQVDLEMIIEFDKVLGFKLHEVKKEIEIPEEVQKLIDAREIARKEKKWDHSDRLRDEIAKLGFIVKDTDKGHQITKM